ncbi:hypothetical protein [Arthrobacter sp. HLT1-20]
MRQIRAKIKFSGMNEEKVDGGAEELQALLHELPTRPHALHRHEDRNRQWRPDWIATTSLGLGKVRIGVFIGGSNAAPNYFDNREVCSPTFGRLLSISEWGQSGQEQADGHGRGRKAKCQSRVSLNPLR